MNNMFKQRVKELVPPIVWRVARKLFLRQEYGYFGDYKNWASAMKKNEGYDDPGILDKVLKASLKVKQGKAAYERDSVVFNEQRYSWPLLAALLRAAFTNDNRLRVLDYGGSLGSSYFQNKAFFSFLDEVRWCVVEQKNFVECGKRYFEDDELCFYPDIESCMKNEQIDTVLLSSVLPYLEKPYELLSKIMSYQVALIIIDRTGFIGSGRDDRLTVQKVPPSIYKASYPAWFFNKQRFMENFRGRYKLIAEFEALGKANIDGTFLGMILEREKNT